MIYEVQWDDAALDDLLALPKHTATAIKRKVESYLVQNPRQLGTALTGRFSGLYRYRMGDYRIVYQVIEKEVVICIVRVGHRKDVYDV